MKNAGVFNCNPAFFIVRFFTNRLLKNYCACKYCVKNGLKILIYYL